MANTDVQKRETTPQEPRIRPLSTICECEGEVQMRVEMPGVAKDGLDIQVDNDQLRITGTRKEPAPEGRYVLRERPRGSFFHAFTLDETIDRNKIEATMEKGVLTLKMRLSEAAKPRKIEVKSK